MVELLKRVTISIILLIPFMAQESFAQDSTNVQQNKGVNIIITQSPK